MYKPVYGNTVKYCFIYFHFLNFASSFTNFEAQFENNALDLPKSQYLFVIIKFETKVTTEL